MLNKDMILPEYCSEMTDLEKSQVGCGPEIQFKEIVRTSEDVNFFRKRLTTYTDCYPIDPETGIAGDLSCTIRSTRIELTNASKALIGIGVVQVIGSIGVGIAAQCGELD